MTSLLMQWKGPWTGSSVSGQNAGENSDTDFTKYRYTYTLADAVAVEEDLRKQGIILNTNLVPLSKLVTGMNVEREHGAHNPITNVTSDNRMMAAKIALAHFEEDPVYYYDRLEKAEDQAKEHWRRNGGVPKIFKSK